MIASLMAFAKAALAAYDGYRRPRANMALEQSLIAGDNLESLSPGGEEVTRQRIKKMYETEWIHDLWHHDFEGEVTRVLEQL